jgi:GNAT superfamily N-acetyltransferase
MKLFDLFEALTYKIVKDGELYRELLKGEDEPHERLKYLSRYWKDKDDEIDIICLDDKKVVGVAGLQQAPDEERVIWVKFISVDPAARQQGIGRTLVEEVFKYAKAHNQRIRASSYTEMGQAHLKKIFDEMAKRYSDVGFKDATDHYKFDI